MSGKNPIPNEQAYQGVRAVSPPNVVVASNAPGSNQKRVHLGDIQIDESTGIAYMLTDIVAGAQVWSVVGEGTTGDIITITGDSGGAQPGNAGNFTLSGTANQILITGSASTETFSLVGPYAPSTYTDHAVLVGSGTAAITALTVGATGEVLIGATGADPAFGALGVNSGLTVHGVLLGADNSAIVATTAGTDGQVLIGATGADPAFGALGVDSGLTDHGVLVGGGVTAIDALAVGATGEVLIGSTGADPAFGALGVNSGLTDHGVLVGSGNAAIDALVVGATGEVLIGSTGADPAFGALGVNSGLTDHGVLVGSGNSAIDALVVGTDGQVIVGSTGADPVFATISSSTLTVTGGAGTLALDVASTFYNIVSVTLTSAEIKALETTPITLLAAQGLGTTIVPLQVSAKFTYGGTNVFTNPQDISIGFTTMTGTFLATVTGTGFLDQTASMYNFNTLDVDILTTAVIAENAAIVMTNQSTAITGNAADDNTITVTMVYTVV